MKSVHYNFPEPNVIFKLLVFYLNAFKEKQHIFTFEKLDSMTKTIN